MRTKKSKTPRPLFKKNFQIARAHAIPCLAAPQTLPPRPSLWDCAKQGVLGWLNSGSARTGGAHTDSGVPRLQIASLSRAAPASGAFLLAPSDTPEFHGNKTSPVVLHGAPHRPPTRRKAVADTVADTQKNREPKKKKINGMLTLSTARAYHLVTRRKVGPG